LLDTIEIMKHKHAIEAYKLQALKGGEKSGKKTTQSPGRTGSEKRPGGSERTENNGLPKDGGRVGPGSARESQTGSSEQQDPSSDLPNLNEGRIFRGSTINAIVSDGGFLKTGFGHKKAAKLLLLLGKDEAAQVLKHLEPDEIEKVTAEIARIRKIEKPEAEKILEEFGELADEIASIPRGGLDVAREMLITSFGFDKAERVLKRITPYAEGRPFSFLNDLEFQQIMLLLRKEPVHVMSIVISYLEPSKASQVLESLPPESQALIVRRISRLGKVSPEVVSSIEQSLRERIKTQGKVITEEIDGQQVLTDILKHLPMQDEDRILASLEEKNEALARLIRERLFSIESVLEIPDKQLQGILQKYPDRDIAAILKGKSEEVQEKLLRNVSDRRREFIKGEREHLGPMKRSKVDGITKDFLMFIRQKVEQGEITLETDELI